MKQLLAVILFVSAYLINWPVHCQTIKVVAEVFPPATNADGSGRQFDMVNAIYGALGYDLEIGVYPYKRAKKLIENVHADIMVGVLHENDSPVLYSQLPIDADNLVIVYPKMNQSTWQGLSSLANKHLSVIAGFSQAIKTSLPDFPYQMSEVNTREQAFKKLLFNRTDFLVDCECGFLLEESANYRVQFETQHLGYLTIYIAFADSEKGKKLKAIWDQQFPPFIHSKVAHDIYQKWGMLREYQILLDYVERSTAPSQ